jgi:hypothetical protein
MDKSKALLVPFLKNYLKIREKLTLILFRVNQKQFFVGSDLLGDPQKPGKQMRVK